MKKIMFTIGIVCYFFISCSKDDSPIPPKPPQPPASEIRIVSYSKNSGYPGDTIKIIGENFPIQISTIAITFDAIPATVLSATPTQITLILPTVQKEIPELVIKISNKIIPHPVQNEYQGNISILTAQIFNTWQEIVGNIAIERQVSHVQMQSDKILYYSVKQSENFPYTGSVYRTLDGGLTWTKWANCDQFRMFYANTKGEGWAEWNFGINRTLLPSNNLPSYSQIFTSCIAAYYIDDTMLNGLYVSDKGSVNTTTDGGLNFNTVFSSSLTQSGNEGTLYQSFSLDKDNIWTVGYKYISGKQTPLLLFKNNGNNWREITFDNLPDQRAEHITFLNKNFGILVTTNKTLKTTDGGNTWINIGNGQTKTVFVDDNNGWFITSSYVFKTIDGGKTWNQDFRDRDNNGFTVLECKNNVIWAIAGNKTYKYYFKS